MTQQQTPSPQEHLVGSLRELMQMHEVFKHDLMVGILALQKEGTQSEWRSFVRALFAAVEGTCFGWKQVLLGFESTGRFPISRAEATLLCEEAHELKPNGTPHTRHGPYLAIDRNVRFVFRMLSRFCGEDLIDYGEQGWEAFQGAISIRNRLTHPKTVQQLLVSADDSDVMMKATKWWLASNAYLLEAVFKHLIGASHDVRSTVEQRVQESIRATRQG